MGIFNFSSPKKETTIHKEKTKFISEERISRMMLEITEFPFGKTDIKELPFVVDITKSNLDSVANCLVFLDSEDSWKTRDFLLENKKIEDKNIVMIDKILKGLAGLDSEKAWKTREKLIEDLINNYKQKKTDVYSNFFMGLSNVNSSEAWRYRDLWSTKEKDYPFSMPEYSLYGLDNKEANALRKAHSEFAMKGLFFPESIIGLDSDFAWQFRNKLLKEYPEDVMQSLAGLDSEKAWKMRNSLVALYGYGDRLVLDLLKSLISIDTLQSWRIREGVWQSMLDGKLQSFDTATYNFMAMSIAGLDSNDAWRMRQKISERPDGVSFIPLSINGDYISGTVWRMKRDRENTL